MKRIVNALDDDQPGISNSFETLALKESVLDQPLILPTKAEN
ncbi:hypothetical protein [Leptolyngbya sp. FACHB-321]|nr:hypothetical protein [Leptolyngbya sp. FACHB-321]